MLTSAPTIFFWTATLLHPVLGCGRGPAFLLRATTPSTPTADSTQPASTPSKHGSTSPQAPTSTPDPNDRGASNRSGALEAEVPLWVGQAQGPFGRSVGTASGRPGCGPVYGHRLSSQAATEDRPLGVPGRRPPVRQGGPRRAWFVGVGLVWTWRKHKRVMQGGQITKGHRHE